MIYHRKIPGDKKILYAQSGHIESGTITAIIGPRGAGKTTLLNIISGRLGAATLPSWFLRLFMSPSGEKVHGENVTGKVAVRFDGPYFDENRKRFRIGFVPHKDHLLKEYTIRETLTFAAKINDEKGQWRGFAIKQRIEKILTLLKLDTLADARISELTAVQQKITSIGVEMVSNPQVLVLEGPSERLGWDDTEQIVLSLTRVSKQLNVAVCCTMYNTPFDLLCNFDMLYIVSKYGYCVYFDKPRQLIPTLIKCNFKLPPDVNPGEFAIEVAAGKFGFENLAALNFLAKTATKLDELSSSDILLGELKCCRIVAPFYKQVWFLFTRLFSQQVFRSKVALLKLLWPILAVVCLCNIYQIYPGVEDGCWSSIMMNNTYFQYEEKLRALNSNISLIISALFLFSVVPCATNVMGVQLELLTTRKEIKNSWYSIFAYTITRMFVDVVITTLTVAPSAICLFYASKQIEGGERVYIFVWTLILFANTWSSKGFVFSTLLAPGILGLIFTVVLEFMAMFLTGSQVKRERFFCLLKALNPLSDAKMAFELMTISIYSYGRCVPNPQHPNSTVNLNVDYIFDLSRMEPMDIALDFWPQNQSCPITDQPNITETIPAFNQPFILKMKDLEDRTEWPDYKFSYILSLWEITESNLFGRFLVLALKYLFVRVIVYFRLLYTFKILMKFDEFDTN